MRDALLFLGGWIGLGILAAVLFSRYKRRRPYLAARWDDTAGDWVNQTAHDVGPDPLRLIADLEQHLKAYGNAVADLYEPVAADDHTTNPTGDQ